MHLVRMIYASTSVKEVDSELLQSILETAKSKNFEHDLTGLLVFDDKYFLQVIEGARTAVSDLLGNLYKDKRHKDLVMLGFETISKRHFPHWSMQFVPVVDLTRDVLLRYGTGHQFEPYSLTKEGADAFLVDMMLREQARSPAA